MFQHKKQKTKPGREGEEKHSRKHMILCLGMCIHVTTYFYKEIVKCLV